MDIIHRQKPFLKAITSAANRNRRKHVIKHVIKHANKDQVNAVGEIVLNLLKKKCACNTRHHGKIKTLQANPETNWKSSCIA